MARPAAVGRGAAVPRRPGGLDRRALRRRQVQDEPPPWSALREYEELQARGRATLGRSSGARSVAYEGSLNAERRDAAGAQGVRRGRDQSRGRDRPQAPGGGDHEVGHGGRRPHPRAALAGGPAPQPPHRVTPPARVDASGVALELGAPPQRIVSLIPSTTELLCALGLADALVGVTVYCLEPRDVVRGKTRVGGEKDPDLSAI